MNFVVETGEGLVDATSYASTEIANDYAYFFDIQDWLDLQITEQERLLVRATNLIDLKLDFPSKVLNVNQSLAFPRIPFNDNNGRLITGVPEVIQEVTIRVAIMLKSGWVHNKQKKGLKAQSYGNSSETYYGVYYEGADNLDKDWEEILAHLSKLGIASKYLKQVTLVRG